MKAAQDAAEQLRQQLAAGQRQDKLVCVPSVDPPRYFAQVLNALVATPGIEKYSDIAFLLHAQGASAGPRLARQRASLIRLAEQFAKAAPNAPAIGITGAGPEEDDAAAAGCFRFRG